jgi:amino acid adenylation domain-containing protein
MLNETLINLHSKHTKPTAADLSAAKRRLLESYLCAAPRRNGEGVSRIHPRPQGEAVPLSFSQEQVWLHAQMAGDVPFYNEPITIYRRGPLDAAVLERCLLEIIRRHEIWRTTFDVIDGEPVQIVHPAPTAFPLPVLDLRELPEDERQPEAVRLATEDARRPFDLKLGPLVRAVLVRTKDEEHCLYLTVHQIVFDAVTAYQVLLPELTSLYEAFAAGRPSPLPELNIQYPDFAYWQRRQLNPELWSEHMAYWRRQLAGEPSVLDWPSDHPRPPIETHRGTIQRFTLPADVVQSLREFGRQQGTSFYMTLLAGMATLLHRYTAQEDIILGSFTAGRKLAEIEPLLGYFVNPLPLRIDVSGNPTFKELQSRVRAVVLDALAHDDLPFVHAVKETQANPDPSRNPLFQVVLSQQPKLSSFPGWELATEEVCNGGSKLDLTIVVDDRGESVFGPIIYNPDLFDAATITRMVGHWRTLLMAAMANPEMHIADLPILTEAERNQILFEWADTRREYPQNLCAHQIIEAQVQQTPDAIALVCEQTQVSYRELNARANQLAHHLRRLGVGSEVLVGICMKRSVEMVVALLAIWKVGGAYVPLDPAYPTARLQFMIEDSSLRFLITEEALATKFSNCSGTVVSVDRDWPAISKGNEENLPADVEPRHLAYVIYTSGSTGRPKGVQIPHRALVNFVISMRSQPGLTQQDSLLAVTTISFDIAALELYLPLTVGARCVLASRGVVADGHELRQLLETQDITVMQATPATWKLLLESGWRGKQNLKILCGGEAMSRELAEQLLGRGASLWNLYGPTETTVWSTIHPVTSPNGPVPIGRPIANTDVYILDRNLHPVPIGINGELYIGGHGVARGYLNRSELDAEKFILNPFSSEPDARLYRTGDQARYCADGNLECLGRLDHQVKLRGFRIELGEIESLLREHGAVTDTCVIVRDDLPAGPCLIAYVTLTSDQDSLLEEIRNFLKERLPGYMVPILHPLKTFPLTPSGKLDRRALPAPEHRAAEPVDVTEEFDDPAEQTIANIWREVLKVERVSAYDNFFDLGGHSLLAMQVVGRLEKDLGARMKPKELAFQTLRQFAASCTERLARQ